MSLRKRTGYHTNLRRRRRLVRSDVRVLNSRKALGKIDTAIAEIKDVKSMMNLYGADEATKAAWRAINALDYFREVVEEMGF